MKPGELAGVLDSYLESEGVEDYCPNGLQVEGEKEIRKIISGVSASQELFMRAVEAGADGILVHHGILWNGSRAPRIVGVFRERLALLIKKGISLIAYHLPLDRHLELGNAAVMARKLGLEELRPFGRHHGLQIGVCGEFTSARSLEDVVAEISEICRREADVFGPEDRPISSIGIVTGAAQREYYQAVEAGLDAYITGEVSEWVFQQAREEGVPYIAAGHYATERFGVQALGRWIEKNCGIEVEFIDLPNPI